MNTINEERAGVKPADWIEAQAEHYRSLGTDLARLAADRLAELARDWRAVAGDGAGVSVATFEARMEVLAP
jgi:hypothetical protein